MPAEIIQLDVSECFTLGLDADGKPVERSFSEMTAGEVLRAMQWIEDETDLTLAIIDAITQDPPLRALSEAEKNTVLRECEKARRLMELVRFRFARPN